MSDTLLLTKEREGGQEGGRAGAAVGAGGAGDAGVAFLIEFPDNAEINLTPVKFDYVASAVASFPTHPARVSSLALAAFVSPVCRQSARRSIQQHVWGTESLNHIYLRPGLVRRYLKEYYLSFCLTVCLELSWAHSASPWVGDVGGGGGLGGRLFSWRPSDARRRTPRVNSRNWIRVPARQVHCLGNLSYKWQNESTRHGSPSTGCCVTHRRRCRGERRR